MKKALIVGVLLLTGCYKTTITGMGGSPGYDTSKKAHGVIYGLVMLNDIDAGKICGDKGVYSVDTKIGFVDMLASMLTAGIYTPITVVVTCKG